jgi:hypothetical protein
VLIDGGRKRDSVIIVLGMGCPSSRTFSRGERIREGPTKLYHSFPPSRFGGSRDRADKIVV